jgi:ABC-type bacteriocin/lantibiotic exporter with double-glycine peptidase domain
MTQEILRNTLKRFAELHGQSFDPSLLKNPESYNYPYQPGDFQIFIHDLISLASKLEFSLKINYLEEGKLRAALKEIPSPSILFEKTSTGWVPLIHIPRESGKQSIERVLVQGIESLDLPAPESSRLIASPEPGSPDKDEKFILISGMSCKSLVSHLSRKDGNSKPLSPAKRLMRLLGNEGRDIGYIYVYAMIIGLISLSLPIGIQSIINLISGGMYTNSIVVLISLVIVGVLVSGGLQILQMTMVEILQRRIFAKASFELAYRVPRIRIESLAGYYPPELMNRFFEVVNIQKGLPKLLIDISAAMLQIIFGMLLLSFYHPFFVVFSLLLVAVIFFIFRFTGSKGLETSLKESKFKYKTAEWFEELARTLSTFKLAGTTNLPLEKTDRFVNNYLNYRKKHFGILLSQYGNVLVFKTLVTGGILILGTMLVVDRQITLGQFVASELVIIIVVGALEKIVLNIDVAYDLLTAVEKLGQLTDFPLENHEGFVTRLPGKKGALEIELKDIHFTYPNSEREALNGLSLEIPSGSRFCIAGFSESGKETLGRLLGGLYTEYQGIFTVNGISFRDLDLNFYRDLVSKNFDRSEIIDGTILENITLGKPDIQYQDVALILEKLGLMEEINRLPQGILTHLVGTGNKLAGSVLEKIILARCLVTNPGLLIISYPVLMLEKSERNSVYQVLMNRNSNMTVGFISNDEDLMKACDQVFVLNKGKLLASGSFEQIQHHLPGN